MKRLGRRGRLTDNIIDKLQIYYGIAIRQNSCDLYAIKSATATSLFYVALFATNDYHTHCPSVSGSLVGAYSKQIKQIILAHTNLHLVCI